MPARAITLLRQKADPEILSDLCPEVGLARCEQRILACVPAQEMWRMRMFGVRFAARPHFVQQQRARRIHRSVKVVGEAALFFS